MTKAALKIIGGEKRSELMRAFGYVRRAKEPRYFIRTKADKQAAKSLISALRRLKTALQNPAFDPDPPGAKILPAQFLGDLLRDTFGIDPSLLAIAVKEVEQAAKRKGPPHIHARNVAVRQAAKLLEQANIAVTTTRTGPFCRLSAVLYGDPNAKFYDDCRAYIKGRKTA